MFRTAAKALLFVLLLTTPAISIGGGDTDIRPRPGTGNFLLLSDLHFDPFADAAMMRHLGAIPNATCQSNTSTAFAAFGSDSNYLLLRSMLDNAVSTAAQHHIHYDYIVVTGDLLSHQFDMMFQKCIGGDDAAYQKFVSSTIHFVDQIIAKTFPSTPIFTARGNNDSDRGDYAPPTAGFLQTVAHDWSPNWGRISDGARESAISSIKRGGYYAIANPAVPSDQLVVLNANLWVARNATACTATDPDPAGQFQWLQGVLAALKNENRRATLMMHVLPGIDALRSSAGDPQSLWTIPCTQKFIDLLSDYRGTVQEIYAGHIHRDDFRILPDRDGNPLLPIHIAPSVSPVYFNNPAFEVGWYDKKDGRLSDFAPIYLDLANKKTTWATEYVFTQGYHCGAPDLATLVKLSTEIHYGNPSSGVGKTYADAYNVGIGLFLTPENWGNYACAQTEVTVAKFSLCRAAANRHKP